MFAISRDGAEVVPGMLPKLSKGMEIVTSDGTKIRTGVPQTEYTKKTQGSIEDKLHASSSKMQRMSKLIQNFSPELLDRTNKLKAELNNQLEAWNLKDLSGKEKQELAKITTYAQDAIENINATIQEISGAEMSEKEANRLRLQEPDMGEHWWKGDGPTKFKTKLLNTYQKTQKAIARYHYIVNNGFEIDVNSEGDATVFRGRSGKPIDLDDMPALINKRAQEIEAEIRANNTGLTVDLLEQQTEQRLAEEFGLVQ